VTVVSKTKIQRMGLDFGTVAWKVSGLNATKGKISYISGFVLLLPQMTVFIMSK